MGFALLRFSTLTRFTTLTELCQGISKKMSRYHLSALVLNDPSDCKFIRHMGEHMDELNSRTGENFLFFSLVDPPKEWGGAINPKFRDLRLPPSDEKKDRMMLYNFLAQVELDDVPLPGILLTSGDLKANSCVYIPTNTEVINDQLLALGDFCSHRGFHSWIELGDPDLQRLIDEISIEDPVWSEGLPQSIAESLRLVSAVREINGINEKDAIKCINQALDRLSDKQDPKYYTTLASCLEHAHDPFVQGCNFDEGSINPFEELEGHVIESLNPLDIESIEGLDRGTKRAWTSYNSSIDILEAKEAVEDILDRGIETSIYSAPLFKGLENELNLSIVQAMRERLGIPMPEYYAKYCPDGNAVIVRSQNRHRIDLNCARPNRNRIGDLEAVSIGNIRGAYLELMSENEINCFVNNDEFCDMLNKFSRLRATLHAGHTYEFELEALLKSNQLMNDLFVPNYLSRLIEIKKDLLANKIS